MKVVAALALWASFAPGHVLCPKNSSIGAPFVPAENGRAEAVRVAVDSAASAFLENRQTIGLSIGIVQNRKEYTFDYGTTDREQRRLPTARTQYPIASITKTFTGALLAQAVVEKRVKLDDDVRKYLDGDFPNLEFHGQPVRLCQLINHTSGLPTNSALEMAAMETGQDDDVARKAEREQAFLNAYTEADFYRELHAVRLTRAPGEKFSYSNVAAQLLGLVLERVYRKSYEELIRSKIAGPLRMRDTKVALTPSETARLPRGYAAGRAFVWPLSARFPAAGALKSTTTDMLKYIAWHLAEKDEAVVLSHQPAGSTVWSRDGSFTVGLNWQILRTPVGRDVFQDGNVPGYHSMCVFCPELHVGIIVLTNEQVGATPAPLSPLVDRILKAVDPRFPATP